MSRSVETLGRLPLFAGLSPQDIDAIDAQCLWRRVASGSWLIDYGEGGTDVFFVLFGRLRVTIQSAAGEVILRDLVDGDHFGELAAIDGRPRSAGIQAITDSVVGRVSADRFLGMVHRYPSVCDGLLRSLAGEIRKLANQVNEFSTMPVKRRLHAELLRLARPRAGGDGHLVISPPPTHAELAARIATHREAVTRELKALERDGLLEKRRGAIALTDPDRLRRMVEAEEA